MIIMIDINALELLLLSLEMLTIIMVVTIAQCWQKCHRHYLSITW